MNGRTNWRKSSYSGSGGGNCVEVAGDARCVMVRDTRQARMGHARTVLTVTPDAWREFAASLKQPGSDGPVCPTGSFHAAVNETTWDIRQCSVSAWPGGCRIAARVL